MEISVVKAALDNAQLEMARAKLNIASQYTTASETVNFHEQIMVDFRKAEKAILSITKQTSILENQEVIHKSIQLRNPYTDVLNLLQIELMQRCHAASESECEMTQHALFLSINGIAAAMQSTG